MKKPQVIWANSAKAQLKSIYNYYRYDRNTLQGAKNVKNEILKACEEIVFEAQYQKDEVQPEYRRIIVRQFKILYKINDSNILILRIVNTSQDPKNQIKNNPPQ